MILEDNKTDVKLNCLQLETLDFDTTLAITDKEDEYIDLIDTFKPDLILSDFSLPSFDGLKALRFLRERDQITPFIFVTGSLGEENAVKAIKMGATDFISKQQIHQLPAAIIKALRELEEINAKNDYMKQVLENEKRFKALVQSGTDFIAIVDEAGLFSFASDTFYRFLGYSIDDLLGKPVLSFIYESDHKDVQKGFESLKKKNMVQLEFRFKNAFDKWRWFRCTITNMMAESSVHGVVLNAQDVTSNKQKEDELELSNERYRLASLATQDLIYDWDLTTGEIKRDHHAISRMLGYDYKDTHTENFWKDKVHPEDMPLVYKNLKDSIANPKVAYWERQYRFCHANGAYVYLHDSTHIVRDSAGNAIRLIGAVKDISVRKTQEQARELMLTISSEMSQPKQLSIILESTLKLLVSYTQATVGEIWLKSKSNKEYVNLSAQYVIDKKIKPWVKKHNVDTVKINEGFIGTVLKTGAPTALNDLKNSKTFVRKELAKQAALQSGIGIPIQHGDQTIGVLFFLTTNRHQLHSFTNVLVTISELLAPDIQRKMAEEELNNFFTISPDILCVIGLDGCLKKVNPAITKILGYTAEELQDEPILNHVHPDEVTGTKEKLKSLSHGESIQYFENRWLTKSGKVKWFSWSSALNKEDKVLMAVARDITEKKTMELLVKQSQKMAKMGSWEVDLINDNLVWTTMTKEIHGVGMDYEPDLSTALDFYKEGYSRDLVAKCIEAGIKSGASFDIEIQIVIDKKKEIWVRTMGQAEMVDGKCIRLFGSIQDIDELKKREQELAQSKERFELATKATHEVIYEWDRRTNKIIWAHGYYRLFGYEEKITDLDTWKSRVHKHDKARIMESRERTMNNPMAEFWSEEYRYHKADRGVAIVVDRGYIVRNEKGEAIKTIGAMADITEERKFQEKLLENTILSREKEANRIARELHDGIVQEMTACGMMLENLRQCVEDNNQLDQELASLSGLVRKVTNETRDISHHLLSADVETENLSDMLSRLEHTLNKVSKIGFKCSTDVSGKLNEQVKVNIYRTIQELTNNIIKHSGASSSSVDVYESGNQLIVNVEDDGVGISPKSTGGIGLSNVKNRIESIGGTIDFGKSNQGGFSVSIKIPSRQSIITSVQKVADLNSVYEPPL